MTENTHGNITVGHEVAVTTHPNTDSNMQIDKQMKLLVHFLYESLHEL